MTNESNLSNKERFCQYFTVGNPFKYQPFTEWFAAIPEQAKKPVLEPFAGANHIPEKFPNLEWKAYDIDPQSSSVQQRDTLENFPEGFTVCVTNPPYIAQNAATRMGLPFPDTEYDDLYKLALDQMLSHCQWVAAIIPESFITANLFHDRLKRVMSIPEEVFEDTEHPVCVAMFNPKASFTHEVFFGNEHLGTYQELQRLLPQESSRKFTFNDPEGALSLVGIDNTRKPSIRFSADGEVSPNEIKVSSRSRTLISSPFFQHPEDVELIARRANKILNKLREKTRDVFLTAFKGRRKDGMYRRRLDFGLARRLLTQAVHELQRENTLSG